MKTAILVVAPPLVAIIWAAIFWIIWKLRAGPTVIKPGKYKGLYS